MRLLFLSTIFSILALAQQTQQARVVICTDAGANETYTCTPNPAVTSYTTRLTVQFYPNSANTSASATLNISGLGAKSIKKVAGGITSALVANDIRAGQYCNLIYDGTNFQMVSQLGNAAAGGAGNPINTTANEGYWWPFGGPSYSAGGVVITPSGANRGYRYQITVPVKMTFRAIHINVSTVGGAGTAVAIGIYNTAQNSIIASALATVGGTPSMGTTGPARILWSGGSAVSSGVLTLDAGVYYLVFASDSTAVAFASYGSSLISAIPNATTTTNVLSQTYEAYSATAISTGTGSGLTLTTDISAVSWSSANTTNQIICAFVN